MPSWPSSTSSPENNEDEMPWHAAVLPALGFVKLTKMAMVVSPGWENQLVVYLDAKVLDENSWAWKRLQEVDPDFRKIRAIRDYTVTLPNYEQATTFPNEWKDETFHNWMCVNIQPLLMCTDEGKLERAIHVLTNTDYVARWQAEKKKRKENLDKIERLRIKEEERLVKEQKTEEEIRLKEIRSQRILEKEENYE